MKLLRVFILCTALPFMFSCSTATEGAKDMRDFIGNISYCEEVKSPLKPTVCGKCRLKYEKDRIYIIPAEDCPPYTVYKCTTKDGKSFTINNLHCRPVEAK